MDIDKWKDIKLKVKEKFGVTSEEIREDEGRRETVEEMIFDGPMGKMKLEFVSRPRVIDRKTSYSNRIGSDVQVDYVYDDSEITHRLDIYRWQGDEWLRLKVDNFSL
ncbi:MAG: hypothetical protein NUV82_03590 [Candidatus Komeilibacteria bacterium]|nr:hypothetical protein [Candidatus Komeilibacteria bacterium]